MELVQTWLATVARSLLPARAAKALERLPPCATVSAALIGCACACGYLAKRALTLPRGPNLLGWSGCVVGHRGCRLPVGSAARRQHPENTLEAFAYALDRSADGVEFDVRLIRSGEFVVFHDGYCAPLLAAAGGDKPATATTGAGVEASGESPIRDRQTGGVAFDELSIAQVRQLRFAGADDGIRIPTLDDAIELCRRRSAEAQRVFVEIKCFSVWPSRVREVADAYCAFYAANRDFMDRSGVTISFNPLVLYSIRLRDATIPVCLLHERDMFVENGTGEANEVTHPGLRALPVAALRLMDVAAWYMTRYVFLDVIGASMYGPCVDLLDAVFLRRCFENGVCVYLWGNKVPARFPAPFRRAGTCMSCDDDYVTFKSHFVA